MDHDSVKNSPAFVKSGSCLAPKLLLLLQRVRSKAVYQWTKEKKEEEEEKAAGDAKNRGATVNARSRPQPVANTKTQATQKPFQCDDDYFPSSALFPSSRGDNNAKPGSIFSSISA